MHVSQVSAVRPGLRFGKLDGDLKTQLDQVSENPDNYKAAIVVAAWHNLEKIAEYSRKREKYDGTVNWACNTRMRQYEINLADLIRSLKDPDVFEATKQTIDSFPGYTFDLSSPVAAALLERERELQPGRQL